MCPRRGKQKPGSASPTNHAGYGTTISQRAKSFLEKELEVVRLLHRKGVPFLAERYATGVYVFPGSVLRELQSDSLPPDSPRSKRYRPLHSSPPTSSHLEDSSSARRNSKIADLVLLKANPLEDIANTQKIAAVILNGRYFSAKDLEKMLAGVEAALASNPQRSARAFPYGLHFFG